MYVKFVVHHLLGATNIGECHRAEEKRLEEERKIFMTF